MTYMVHFHRTLSFVGLWSTQLSGSICFDAYMRFFAACATIGFILCTIPKLHYYVILMATAFVGASSFILGVDCFTTAGLKEVRQICDDSIAHLTHQPVLYVESWVRSSVPQVHIDRHEVPSLADHAD